MLKHDVKIKTRKIILSLALYGCDIRSLAVREEHRLRTFENRFLRRIMDKKERK
jgi:phosphopantetheinyl transferase (holo-ACP synthase)